VSTLALIPLLMTALVAVGFAHYALRRWSLAQSTCLQKATQMQTDLGKTLQELLALNHMAQELRHQRLIADRDLAAAMLTGIPATIAAAKLRRDAVIAAQTAFRARQEFLLLQAEGERARYELALRSAFFRQRLTGISSPRFYARALAVRPQPPTSLSPDYVPIEGFARGQQARFQYRVSLDSNLPYLRDLGNFAHSAACSVTLESEGKRWTPKILAASASSNWL
jgi:hypothetical protein